MNQTVVRWAYREWVAPRARKCCCYGTKPREGFPVYEWREDAVGRRYCTRCGRPLRVWMHAAVRDVLLPELPDSGT